jgi:RNA polymerase sigma-70 factor (ECF subfamily)
MFHNNELIEEMGDLRRFALRLTGNAFDAEDLLQSTVLRAMEKKHLFQTDTDLNRWSSKIMFNLFVSSYRRKTKFETKYDPESYLETLTVDASQDHAAELNQVEAAMKHLSPEHREILVLISVKGLRYQEASEVLQLPVGTVRSRLSRARECLQTLLNTPHRNDNMPAYMQRQSIHQLSA